ncbi:O-antigen ligase family protein [Reinekea marina]|uniref:O-antigen ligase family protein n=1 Tax=Reinekea marina TaxID=1310421 RepID=A0ABV7WRR0_9GAMM|nr:O-antigen ligase family protein [Reinekea marina]MDN3649326.1 O-antigen ligase family protein [Reinekea marina]
MTNADNLNRAQLSALNVNRWFPASYDRGPNIMVWVALLACFTTAFIKIWTPTSLNRWPEAIATLLFLYPLIKQWRSFKKQPLIILMIIAIMAPIIFFGINYLQNAEQAKKYALFEPLSRIYLFIPIAWWLGGNLRTIYIFLGLALAGLMYACLLDPNFFQTVRLLFQGHRVDFNILNAQHAALFFSISFIGLISSVLVAARIKPRLLKIFSILMLISLSVLCFIALIGTQTRAALLALAICFCYLIVTLTIKIVRKRIINLTKPIIAGVFSGLLLTITSAVFTYAKFGDSIKTRILSENQTIQALLDRDWNNIPYSSLGIRVNTWILAGEMISEKPLIGYGAKVRLSAIQESDFPSFIKQSFGHFHNSYIEFTLGFGLLGLFIALAPFYFIVKYSSIANIGLSAFSVYGLIVFSVMNFFESYLFFWMGPFICLILCSPILSQAFDSHYPCNGKRHEKIQ